jgi:uncharacterized protein (TIGR04255 family)
MVASAKGLSWRVYEHMADKICNPISSSEWQRKFKAMNIIKSISPDPVISAVVELRFESDVPKEAVYGVMYNALNKLCPESTALPIMQFPEAVRAKAPELRWKPWYQLSGNGLDLQIGPEVIGMNCDCSTGYMGWSKFSKHVSHILSCIETTNLVKNITRIGIRYISFFEQVNIFEKLKLTIHREGKFFCDDQTIFTTLLREGQFIQKIQLNNDVELTTPVHHKKGSTFDIDTFQMTKNLSFEKVHQIIEDGHAHEKKLFFSLLTDDFLNSLNPTYEQ